MQNPSVLVLGGSVSGGGGVGRVHNLTWHAQLGPVKPVVFFKNAIDPSYFLHCTDRFVTREYDVVLLDLGPNMFGSSSGNALEALVRKLRCLTKASSTAIINWPGALRTNASRLAALHTNATFINIPRLRQLYAADKIHPNERGHAFFAKEVRAYLGTLTTDLIDHKSSCDVPQDERCYQNASELPVVGTHKDWKLVDDGIDPSTVHKFGWATKKQGATFVSVFLKCLHVVLSQRLRIYEATQLAHSRLFAKMDVNARQYATTIRGMCSRFLLSRVWKIAVDLKKAASL